MRRTTWRQRGIGAVALAAVLLSLAVPARSAATNSSAAATVSADHLPLPPNAGPDPSPAINSLDCVSDGCVGVGSYGQGGSAAIRALIETEINGTWTAQEAPLPNDAATGDTTLAQFMAVSCQTTQLCTAVGTYRLKGDDAWTGFADTEVAGVWTVAKIPYPADRPGGFLQLNYLQCPAADACYAAGRYAPNDSGFDAGIFASFVGGTWFTADSASTPDGIRHLSCPTATFCAATLDFRSPSLHPTEVPIDILSAGTWATSEIPIPDGLPDDDAVQGFNRLSCPAAGDCVAIGAGMVANLKAGKWTSRLLPLPDGISVDDVTPDPWSVDCASPTWCMAAAGWYGSGKDFAALTERYDGSHWHAEPLVIPDTANPDETFQVADLNCPTDGFCAAVGPIENTVQGAFYALFTDGGWQPANIAVPSDAGATPEISDPMRIGCTGAMDCVGSYPYYGPGAEWQGATFAIPGSSGTSNYAVSTIRHHAASAFLSGVRGHRTGWHRLGGPRDASTSAAALPPTPRSRGSALFFQIRDHGRVMSRTLDGEWRRLRHSGRCEAAPVSLTIGRALTIGCEQPNHDLGVMALTATHHGVRPISAWHRLALNLAAPPAVALVGGAPTFFVTMRSGRLVERAASGRTTELARHCDGGPAAATRPDRSITYVACRRSSGDIEIAAYNGSDWSHAATIAAHAVTAPAIAATLSGPVIAAVFKDQRLWLWHRGTWHRTTGTVRAAVSATGIG